MEHLRRTDIAEALARVFLDGDPDPRQLVERASPLLGRPRWLVPLARLYAEKFARRTIPRHREVVRFILDDFRFQTAKHRPLRTVTLQPHQMQPVDAAKSWDIPTILTEGDLAQWLSVGVTELEWFADLAGLTYKTKSVQLQHYYYTVVTKCHGTFRLIEAPKPRLKKIQRQLLTEILDCIPAHPAAHGFVQGRSIKSFAAPHVGKHVVLRLDLENFFPSIPGPRVQTFFRTLGYPEAVADRLGCLCTNATPRTIWRTVPDRNLAWSAAALHARPHVPQGAPTSPALANACAYRVDCRLTGLAAAAGAHYTRYADDLAFSGDEAFAQGALRFAAHAAVILAEEGFTVNHRKTRIMRRGVRQQLAGLVTNETLNVRRDEFDRLKAVLTNCVRHGSESQNREGNPTFREHLAGRVGFVEMINPAKGARLRRVLNQIEWTD